MYSYATRIAFLFFSYTITTAIGYMNVTLSTDFDVPQGINCSTFDGTFLWHHPGVMSIEFFVVYRIFSTMTQK